MKRRSADLVLMMSAMLSAVGAALFFWPAANRRAPDIGEPVRLDPTPHRKRALPSSLAPAFDHSDLPAQQAPPAPIVDPATSVRRYRYAGLAAGGDRRVALFESGGVIYARRVGETLEDFILTEFDDRRAELRNREFAIEILLHP